MHHKLLKEVEKIISKKQNINKNTKMPELNQEILRKRLVEIYKEYIKSKGDSASINKIKAVVKEYDKIRELLDETLNAAIGILEAIAKKEIEDKKEEEQLIKEITKELNEKSYL